MAAAVGQCRSAPRPPPAARPPASAWSGRLQTNSDASWSPRRREDTVPHNRSPFRCARSDVQSWRDRLPGNRNSDANVVWPPRRVRGTLRSSGPLCSLSSSRCDWPFGSRRALLRVSACRPPRSGLSVPVAVTSSSRSPSTRSATSSTERPVASTDGRQPRRPRASRSAGPSAVRPEQYVVDLQISLSSVISC